MAVKHYHSDIYAASALNLLGKATGREELAVKSFLYI
jgi:hypothetical protein